MVTADEFSVGLVLVKDPHKWSEDEAQLVRESFAQAWHDDRKPVGRLLATQLWRYWFSRHPEAPLMEDPTLDLALMLTAQAFGEFVPAANDLEFFGRYRNQQSTLEQVLTPPPIAWGPRAVQSDPGLVSPCSAVTRVCVFRSNGAIQEVLIVGQSPPEIQQEIFQAACACALRVQAGDLDMLNIDTCRVIAANSDQHLFDLPGITTLGARSTLGVLADQTASDALSELVQVLRSLEQTTGLVSVRECDASAKSDFDRALRGYAQQASRDDRVVLVAKDVKKSPELSDLATLVPCYHISQRPSPLQIVLHPDILESSSFEELVSAFKYGTVHRISADAQARRATYVQCATRLKEELTRWRQADNRTRQETWGEFVTLTETFDSETGTTMRLVQPVQRPTPTYMEVNVPSLITHYEKWAERMQKIMDDIRETSARPDIPIRRLAASRFLDAALRGRGLPTDDPMVCECFQRWSAQVAPLLRLKWQETLKTRGIRPSSVFSQRTVFHTRFQVDDNNDLVGLVMQAFAIACPADTLLIFDREARVMLTKAADDFAVACRQQENSDAQALWDALKQRHIQDGMNQANFTNELGILLAERPSELLPHLVASLLPSSLSDIDKQGNEEGFARQQMQLDEQIRMAIFPTKIITLLNHRAFHTARHSIQQILCTENISAHSRACLLLWQALVECLSYGQSPLELIPPILAGNPESNWLEREDGVDQVRRLLREASQLDPSFVQEWASRLDAKDLRLATSYLNQNWKEQGVSLESREKKNRRLADSAVESALLARALEVSADELFPEEETTGSVLVKTGEALEALLLTDKGVTPAADIENLLEVLVGEENVLN